MKVLKEGESEMKDKAKILVIVVLAILAVLTFYPFVIMLFISFKDISQFDHARFTLTFPLHWENYPIAWKQMSRYILNSIYISTGTVIGVLICGTLTAYALARFNFPGKMFFYYAIISLMMIPGILTLIPSFVLVWYLGLINTRWGLWLPYIAGGQIFVIFVLRTFFASIPEDLFESARIDGASELQSFWHIALPLSEHMVATLAVLNILGTWNDIIWPLLVITRDELRTITIGLLAFQSMYVTQWGILFAGYVIAALPLLIAFMFTSRLFIEGLTSGAIKM